MSSDDSARQGSAGFRQPGTGLPCLFTCDKCSKTLHTQGRKRVRGVWWYCAACAKAKETQ